MLCAMAITFSFVGKQQHSIQSVKICSRNHKGSPLTSCDLAKAGRITEKSPLAKLKVVVLLSDLIF